jgi:hypothetical protein
MMNDDSDFTYDLNRPQILLIRLILTDFLSLIGKKIS